MSLGSPKKKVLQRLRDAVWRKRSDKWQGQWFLHHDNALSHISLLAQQFLAEKNTPVITQPPYSPDAPQGDTFHNRGGHEIECDSRTPEDSKRSLLSVLPTMAGSMEQVCARARVLLWRWLGKRMSYIAVQYHHSRNFLAAPRTQAVLTLHTVYSNLTLLGCISSLCLVLTGCFCSSQNTDVSEKKLYEFHQIFDVWIRDLLFKVVTWN
jgi:hypothetical protein